MQIYIGQTIRKVPNYLLSFKNTNPNQRSIPHEINSNKPQKNVIIKTTCYTRLTQRQNEKDVHPLLPNKAHMDLHCTNMQIFTLLHLNVFPVPKKLR